MPLRPPTGSRDALIEDGADYRGKESRPKYRFAEPRRHRAPYDSQQDEVARSAVPCEHTVLSTQKLRRGALRSPVFEQDIQEEGGCPGE
jgi:hypothetical protein